MLCRYVLNAPLEWADDVARGLMVALSFFGAAGAMAHSENVGIAFFVDRLPPRCAAIGALASPRCWCWSTAGLGRAGRARRWAS